MGNEIIFLRSYKESKECWLEFSESYIKGYAFAKDELLQGEKLYDFLLKSVINNDMYKSLPLLNGNFAAIIKYKTNTYLIADKIRSYPILYMVDGKQLICADSGESVIELLSSKRINIEAEKEFSALGYLSNGDTLINDIYYVPAGEYIRISIEGIVSKFKYFTFSCPKDNIYDKSLKTEAALSLEEAFSRTIESIGNYSNILIPLSGGYDSRLIACLCKKANLQNVVCFTYGRKSSYEVSISKQVAETLGFDWEYVEYNKDVWNKVLASKTFKDFFVFAGCLSGTPHLQDFPALVQLRERGIIDENTVVIPGHSGDLLGGSKIPFEIIENDVGYNKDSLIDLIYNHFFDLNYLTENDIKVEKNRIRKILGHNNHYNLDDFLDEFECEWFIKTKIGNFIINSMRAYEFFGLRWRTPLWDSEYASMWYKIPWKNKYFSRLYNDFMFNMYFRPYHVDFVKENKKVVPALKKTIKKIVPSKLLHAYRANFRREIKERQESNINAFEDIISFICEHMNMNEIDSIRDINTENVNSYTSLYYISLIKNQLGVK